MAHESHDPSHNNRDRREKAHTTRALARVALSLLSREAGHPLTPTPEFKGHRFAVFLLLYVA